jgi:hypothetical protein
MSKPKKMQKFIIMKVTKVRFQSGGLVAKKAGSWLEAEEVPEGILDLGFGVWGPKGQNRPSRPWSGRLYIVLDIENSRPGE